MSETTVPTGSSNGNRMKVVRTEEDLAPMFNFTINQMDFEVDRNREKANKDVEQDSSTGGDTDTSTPIIPGNHQTLDGTEYAKALANPGLVIAKPVQVSKARKGEKGRTEETDKSTEKEDRA